jgi:long-chain acyl-CoA synthetase
MGENACGDVFGWAAREPGRVTFARQAGKDAGSEWAPVTAAEFASRVAEVAAGIRPGDRIGLLAAASPDWVTCDYAI